MARLRDFLLGAIFDLGMGNADHGAGRRIRAEIPVGTSN